MADNVELNTGAGGEVVASDDIGGAQYQRIKIIHGNDGENDGDISTTNPLPVDAGGISSDVNTSSATLAAEATFTGLAERNSYPDVGISVFSSSDGTVYMDFSNNATDWRTFPPNGFEVRAGIHAFHTAVKLGRYYRTRFINSSTDQTEFDLATYYGHFRQGNLPINSPINKDADATIVRPTDPAIEIGAGRMSGISADSKFGFNGDYDVGASGDIWPLARHRVSFTGDHPIYVSSTNAADTNVHITMQYNDINNEFATVGVTLNGRNAVSFGVTASEIYRTENTGSVAALGDVYYSTNNSLSNGVPTNLNSVAAFVPVGYNQTQQCHFRVPANHDALISQVVLGIARSNGSAGSAVIRLLTKKGLDRLWVVKRRYTITTGPPGAIPVNGLLLGPGTFVKMDIDEVSDGNTDVSAEILYTLIKRQGA